MLIVPETDDCAAPMFFKDPVLAEEQFKRPGRTAEAKDRDSQHPALDAQRKVRALASPGFAKDMRWAGRDLAQTRAALVNRGDAKASDIIGLKDESSTACRSVGDFTRTRYGCS